MHEFHEVADIFPMMGKDEFDALKTDIAAHGQREAIWLHPDGRIIDGRNRYRACMELGRAPVFRTWDGTGSLVSFVVSLNLHRRHLTESQRAMVAAKLANMEHGGNRKDQVANWRLDQITQADAAKLLQVGERSIQRAKAVLENAAEELVAQVERGEVAVSAAATVATLPTEWQRVIVEHKEVTEVARDLRTGRTAEVEERVKPHVAHNSGNNEWYTPRDYIEAARKALGSIDLDPASSAKANEVVQATRFYTIDDDGLTQPWTGNVWMNPPYSSDLVGRFAERLIQAWRAQEINAAVVLVNNATETAWFQALAAAASAVCFPRGRVRFWNPAGTQGAPLQGQSLLYIGDEPWRFIDAFSTYGFLMVKT